VHPSPFLTSQPWCLFDPGTVNPGQGYKFWTFDSPGGPSVPAGLQLPQPSNVHTSAEKFGFSIVILKRRTCED
jgi:hypothetical protein